MKRYEVALEKFKNGYNCAQAIACAYAEEMNMSEEDAFRLSEGFGGGLGHFGHTCGTCSAMVMVTSYQVCPDMSAIGNSKNITYPIVKDMVEKFIEENGYLNCFDIIEHGDKTLLDGKKACCVQCVQSVCAQLEKQRTTA